MMKCRKITTILLTLMMMLGMSMHCVSAKEYDYTMTFYAGNHGLFESSDAIQVDSSTAELSLSSDGKKITVTHLKLKDRVGLSKISSVALENEKYYVKGLRQSGRDNNTVGTSSFEVNGDMDYVVAYGIKKSLTTYTVYYQDADGNELAPSMTYYGNVGDKPVIAHRYVDGYAPQAYNLTKTLVDNENKNVFAFVYTPIEGPSVNPMDEGVTANPESTDVTANQQNTATPAGTTNQDNPAAPEGTTNPVAGIADNDTPVADNEIVDLDDEDTPLAATTKKNNSDEDSLYMYLPIGMSVAGALALIVLLFYWKKNKKEQNQA